MAILAKVVQRVAQSFEIAGLMAQVAKRCPSSSGHVSGEGRQPGTKRAKLSSLEFDVLGLLPGPPNALEGLPGWLECLEHTLQELPLGADAGAREWSVKRRVYHLLEPALEAGTRSPEACEGAARLVDQLVKSGYAVTARDRRILVMAGAWQPVAAACARSDQANGKTQEALTPQVNGNTREALTPQRIRAARVYIHLAEHASFYEDFTGQHPEFWSPGNFLPVLEATPAAVAQVGDDIEADEWESLFPKLKNALKTLGRFLVFWTVQSDSLHFDVSKAMTLMETCTEVFERHDRRHGQEISAKVRGDFVEEVVRVAGVLSQLIFGFLEEAGGAAGRQRRADAVNHAVLLLRFLVRVLMLRVPTFGPRAEGNHSGGQGGNMLPFDERQMDTDWVEGLWEHCQAADVADAMEPSILALLFRTMVDMPFEEQKYRLECVAPLLPQFISRFADQLKHMEIPLELSDLKTVVNTVLRKDFVISDLMEEISFYPVLLEFATKRAAIHAVCERVSLQMSTGIPIRLVVPRDNVLDGVCTSLNLQDQFARIDVPVEIEFKTGLVDSQGQEVMDEGEDQGGLRRQWLDRASRHFLASDLFRALSSSSSSNAGGGGAQGLAYWQQRCSVYVPSTESVCRCVQEDWEEQFELFGCILGFALLHKETLPVHFGHNFLRAVFGLKTGPQDLLPLLESVDKTLHTKVKYVLDGSYSIIGDSLRDALEQACLPTVFAVDESLCPGLVADCMLKESGDKIEVTEENKGEFVEKLIDRLLVSGLRRQVECFRRGLLRVVPEEVVLWIAKLMTVKEIEFMVCGADEIDVDDWEQHSQYENGYTKDCRPVVWFWDVARGMTQASRAALLSFATGSSQVPSGGFRFLQPELFTVQRVAATNRCPEAHTCANTIDLPEYTSREELERMLRLAISETGDVFGRP